MAETIGIISAVTGLSASVTETTVRIAEIIKAFRSANETLDEGTTKVQALIAMVQAQSVLLQNISNLDIEPEVLEKLEEWLGKLDGNLKRILKTYELLCRDLSKDSRTAALTGGTELHSRAPFWARFRYSAWGKKSLELAASEASQNLAPLASTITLIASQTKQEHSFERNLQGVFHRTEIQIEDDPLIKIARLYNAIRDLRTRDSSQGLRRASGYDSLITEAKDIKMTSSPRDIMETPDGKVVEVKAYASIQHGNCNPLDVHIRQMTFALSDIDPEWISGILKCREFRHDADRRRFEVAYEFPRGATKPRTLRRLLYDGQETHSRNDRYKICRELAKAVFFIHTVDYVHKNIQPMNIILFDETGSEPYPDALGSPYLVGFGSSRKRKDDEKSQLIGLQGFHNNVYRHKLRRGENYTSRFTKADDIYALGVVLLEIALWCPIFRPNKSRPGEWVKNQDFWDDVDPDISQCEFIVLGADMHEVLLL